LNPLIYLWKTCELLHAPGEVVHSQLKFGSLVVTNLARLLFDHVAEDGRWFVSVSSIVGSYNPIIAMGAYCLEKGTLEQTVKFFAPELALKKISLLTLSARPSCQLASTGR